MILKRKIAALVFCTSWIMASCAETPNLPQKHVSSPQKNKEKTEDYVASADELKMQFHGCKAHQ